MNKGPVIIILQFIVLLFLQLLLFNNIQFSGFINPYVYVLFFLLLPFTFSRALLLFLGLAGGLVMDLFMGTPGVHAAATVLVAYIRPAVLELIAPHDGYEANTLPRISYMGLEWFIKYTVIIVFAHHLTLFYLEVFSFSHFFHTLLKVILSSVFSIAFIILSQFLVFRK
ncbi:MAG: rod shape-determining protein MreD [Bacteroidales bacterium]|nr:rod shape-determining protein MreD [Bacteroidales bacterium]MBN2763691.1 rod shape-determining protein MreD [Bacteroidales bacterium]